MPPKTSNAAGPRPRRSTPRATARKSTPRVAATKTADKITADASTETTPSTPAAAAATTTITSPEPVPSLTDPKIVATPKSSPKATSKSDANKVPAATTPETTPETRKTPSKTARKSTAKAVPSKSSSEGLLDVRATAVPETTSDATGEIASKAEFESALPLPETSSEGITVTKLNSEDSGDLVAQDETLAEKASETATIEAAVPDNVGENVQESAFKAARDGATKTGARTVVKKTVRVVKKVVKKKVPKRVQKGQTGSSNEESGKAEVVHNESEIPNPSVLGAMEVENLDPLESDSKQGENLKPEPNASISMEVEITNSDVAVSFEAKDPNSDPNASIPVAVENSNSSVPGSMQVENPEGPEVAAGKENDSVNNNSYEALVSDLVEPMNNGNEGVQAIFTTKDQNVGLLGNQNDELETENADSGGGVGEEGVKEEVESFEVGGLKGEAGMSYGLVLSGEMEALERRKRRKTEIFIGGLDKDATEEDIRKVFEEIGEIVDVRLMMNDKTGKNKGFAFVRYASAADAKKALTKFARVEVCGKPCGAAPVEGNDTIFLGNIDKKWKSEDIVNLLQEIGIEKIDKVTVMANPNNIECNRGFAFLELETSRDAQNAYRKLQKKDVLGKHKNIKVAWAEPLSEPDEEEMLKVKSVYAEYLPSSWDEEKVKDYFKKFGEIENVVLARNLRSSRRKDFAFVNYTTREDALACIEAFNRESLNDEGSKVNVKVSLAKPMPKGKQVKRVSNPVVKEPPKVKPNAAQPVVKPHQPRNKGNSASSNYEDIRVDRRSSTTAELVHLLREQASSRQPQTVSGSGSVDLNYPYSSPARKRPFSLLGDDPLYSDPRGYPRARFESSFPAASPSYSGLSQLSDMAPSLPYYHQQGAGYTSGSLYGGEDYHNSSQTRARAPYHGSSGIYRRY